MASNYQYRLTQRAADDLNEIVSYLAVELDNPPAADRFLDRLHSAMENICTFPESGSRVLNEFLPDENIRKVLVDHYVLYYLPDAEAETICVLRITYGRRNMDEILKSLDL
jgi:plasmid stabilization system protein ParE